METNLNCDLGEKSIHHSGENDVQLMKYNVYLIDTDILQEKVYVSPEGM